MERSFQKEIGLLKLGAGEVFHGEGILAVTKALLQSGVSYIGGYQGSPVSNLLDVMVQAQDDLSELGIHVEPCTNEASAAAMLGASIMYPVRGAVTWKSIVGTNVAADALSNLSSPGVKGGVLIVVGEDYGEGASVIQERTQSFAMKSTMALFDPRPDLPTIVHLTQKAFELSEASNMPVMMGLRIRLCHLRGSFVASDNKAAAISTLNRMPEPAPFIYERLSHPPVTYLQEKRKIEERLPAARRFIRDHHINELLTGAMDTLGLVVQGGLTSNLIRALQKLGLADEEGHPAMPVLILNAVYPLVPEQVADFAKGKTALLVLEEGQPEYIEQDIATQLHRLASPCLVHGKDFFTQSGEYSTEAMIQGLKAFATHYAAVLGESPAQQAQVLLTKLGQVRRRGRAPPGQAGRTTRRRRRDAGDAARAGRRGGDGRATRDGNGQCLRGSRARSRTRCRARSTFAAEPARARGRRSGDERRHHRGRTESSRSPGRDHGRARQVGRKRARHLPEDDPGLFPHGAHRGVAAGFEVRRVEALPGVPRRSGRLHRARDARARVPVHASDLRRTAACCTDGLRWPAGRIPATMGPCNFSPRIGAGSPFLSGSNSSRRSGTASLAMSSAFP